MLLIQVALWASTGRAEMSALKMLSAGESAGRARQRLRGHGDHGRTRHHRGGKRGGDLTIRPKGHLPI